MKINETPSNHLHTSDLFLSAYLMARGTRLLGHVWRGSRAVFQFEGPSDLQPLVREFWNGGPVSVSDFVQALRVLKSLLYGGATSRDMDIENDNGHTAAGSQ